MRRASALRLLGCLGAALAAMPFAIEVGVGAEADQQKFQQIEHGRYLTTLADCVACHTRQDGGNPFAGGRPLETPFGTIVTPNITPDRETGIGNWTRRAIRQRRTPGNSGRWEQAFSSNALSLLHQDVARRCDGHPRLPCDNSAGAQSGCRQPVAVPGKCPPEHARLGRAVFRPKASSNQIQISQRNGIAAPSW